MDKFINIATRLKAIFGNVAISVNPERYEFFLNVRWS